VRRYQIGKTSYRAEIRLGISRAALERRGVVKSVILKKIHERKSVGKKRKLVRLFRRALKFAVKRLKLSRVFRRIRAIKLGILRIKLTECIAYLRNGDLGVLYR